MLWLMHWQSLTDDKYFDGDAAPPKGSMTLIDEDKLLEN